MAVTYEEIARNRTLAAKYADKVAEHKKKIMERLTEEQKTFFNYETAWSTKLAAAMKVPHAIPAECVKTNLGFLFGTVIPDSEKKIILYFADRLQDYPYSDSYRRRSFRAKANTAYASKLLNMIQEFCRLGTQTLSEPLEKILNHTLPEDAQAYFADYSLYGCGYVGWQVAYALDHQDRKIEDAVRRILTEENGAGMLTVELVRGVLFSHRSEFHELLGKLLLAARLQEGLRQVICENADYGTKEGFLTILRVIDENNLIRFSSVKRAVGTWLGILPDETRDLARISDKYVRLILECIENEPVREVYLAAEDAVKIHIALWSYALDDVNDAVQKIVHISRHGSVHQLLTAGYFASNLDLDFAAHHIAKIILKQHCSKEEVLAVWLPCFMPGCTFSLWQAIKANKPFDYSIWFDSKAEIRENYALIKTLYAAFPGKTKTYSPCVFPWHEATIAKSDFASILCTLAALSEEEDLLDEACELIKECKSEGRHYYFSALLRNPKTAKQRQTALEGLADRESSTRRTAYDLVWKWELSAEEYRSIEDYLRFKGADIRKYVMDLLMRQSDAALTDCIQRLLENKKEEIRLGGLDMLLRLKKNPKRSGIADALSEILSERAAADNLPQKEKILLASLVPEKTDAHADSFRLFTEKDKYLPCEFDNDYTERCAETFARYFPDSALPELILRKKGSTGILGKIKSVITNHGNCASAAAAAADLTSLSQWIEAHKTHAVAGPFGEEILLGNIRYPHQLQKDGDAAFAELWTEWMTNHSITHERLLRALVLYYAYKQKTPYAESCSGFVKTVFGSGFQWGEEYPHSVAIGVILNSLLRCVPTEDLIHLASALALWLIRCVPDDKVIIHTPTNEPLPMHFRMAHLLAHSQFILLYGWLVCKNDSMLPYTFPLSVASAERCIDAFRKIPQEQKFETGNALHFVPSISIRSLRVPYGGIYQSSRPLIDVNAYLYAAYQGIITEPQLFHFLLDPAALRDSLETVTSVTAGYYEKGKQISDHNFYKGARNARILKEFLGKEEADEEDMNLLRFAAHVYETIIPVILEAELRRGDSPAAYSPGIRGIARIYGATYFSEILSAMGGDTLDRSAHGGWGADNDRQSSLSYLLSVCIPAEEDSADTLRQALAGKNIPTKRLVEAALFSPEWIPIIGKYLNFNSFESVCYYFMAHMNERFDDKRKAMIAKFTPFSEEELNLGAFDVNWFRSAYNAIGEKDFMMIYDAAKYISDGAKHARARKYADAALGKFDVDETEKTVSDKRNKDLLMAYALIPLKDEADLCRRYLYIQRFRKESKQFGSQRAASEGKAVEMALANLSINAGYSDTLRLTLQMETKIIDDSRSLLEEQIIEGVSLRIAIDESGKASLICEKDGKQLKSVPAKLKKNETVLALSSMVKTLTEQYRRTRVMLERSMEDSTVFTFRELTSLSSHPVVYPMLKNLVLVSGDAVGFLSDRGLLDDAGTVQALAGNAEIRIAHPFDLYTRGCWKNYQKVLFENKITQPFRQVFRELYIKTPEESEMLHSLRYAGNQIQPGKTVAALKSRRWVADVEDGLQKVYYKENIVAQIYALADWFSPADIEAPTLEWVCFTNRKTGAEIKIADIPAIIFSEVMRDVDLAVSIAHAGGVDPETSHSTMEMRAAILSFVLPMFRVENVKTEGHYAIVNGKLAEYSIRLGSGVVHQIGGAMIPVLPVHSQHRGKIFLPFVDDDPKTAEIISKVLLFADDSKIKDPMILAEIRK